MSTPDTPEEILIGQQLYHSAERVRKDPQCPNVREICSMFRMADGNLHVMPCGFRDEAHLLGILEEAFKTVSDPETKTVIE